MRLDSLSAILTSWRRGVSVWMRIDQAAGLTSRGIRVGSKPVFKLGGNKRPRIREACVRSLAPRGRFARDAREALNAARDRSMCGLPWRSVDARHSRSWLQLANFVGLHHLLPEAAYGS